VGRESVGDLIERSRLVQKKIASRADSFIRATLGVSQRPKDTQAEILE